MKRIIYTSMGIGIVFVVLTTGCLTVSKYKMSFDYTTGIVTREYYDIGSVKRLNEKNYSSQKDWESLKKLIEDKKSEFDPKEIEDISKVLYEENKALCARTVQKVKCPKCFTSKAELLAKFTGSDMRFEMMDKKIALILSKDFKIISTNGKLQKNKSGTYVLWPDDATRFEFLVSIVEKNAGKVSLLPYYLKEKGKK